MTLEELHVTGVPGGLKDRVVADCVENEASLNDVVVGLLAEHFRVPFVGTGRRSPGANPTGGDLLLRMPDRLRQKIKADVARQPKGARSITAVVCRILREHYDEMDSVAAA